MISDRSEARSEVAPRPRRWKGTPEVTSQYAEFAVGR